MRLNELLKDFVIYTTNEEEDTLKKIQNPVPLYSLSEHDQYVVETLIRKGLVIKINNTNPVVVANELN